MNTPDLHHSHHDDVSSKVTFGFWTYIMTDMIMFAALFATFIVLRNATYGGIGIAQVIYLPGNLLQTLIMLTMSLVYGLGFASVYGNCKKGLVSMLILTFILGILFLSFVAHDFSYIISQGYNWKSSAFLSAYFTLIAIFSLHVIVAMFWLLILLLQLFMQGITETMKTRFTCLGLFWNFLTIVWLLIFTIVYLMGAI